MKKSTVLPSLRRVKVKSGTSRSRSVRGASGLFHAVGHDQKKYPPITVEEFDRKAEAGEDLTAYFEPGTMSPAQFRRYLERQGIKAPAGL